MNPLTQGMRSALAVTFVALLAVNGVLWGLVYAPKEPHLTVSFLDVGQGDSILIQGPTGIEVLVDGGANRSVLRELPRKLGIFDRSLEAIVATHPDQDHIAGLTDVLARYRVSTVFSSGVERDTTDAVAFQDAATREPGAVLLHARRGMRIHLGDGAYADVLYPDRDVSTAESNDGSIVMRVVYGSTSFLLTGDAPLSTEAYLMRLNPDASELQSTVLKAGHHGSRTSTSVAWLSAVAPQTVVISAGKDNRYGHPHQEVTDSIQAFGAEMVSTADSGTLRFVSDGASVWQR